MMEVVLERVQFKFASIIGELCSEPLVLSQFAVWVDMRLAEYKLKGSISLDCSGETPDPIWMKGITFALTEKLKEAQSKAVKAQVGFRGTKPQPRTGIGQSDSHLSSYSDGPSLSEITHGVSGNVIVKAEPVDEKDIYPLSLYANSDQQENTTLIKDARKRPASTASNMTSPYITDSEPLAKSSRLSMDDCEITEVTGEADNTSLLSIIGMNTSQDNHASTSQNIDTVTLEGDDSIQEYLSSPRQMGDNSSMISSQGSSNHVLVYGNSHPNTTDCEAQKESLHRSRTMDRRLRSHITVFERWMKETNPVEQRLLENIPPQQLDRYLADFVSTAKTSRGEDFSVKSLSSMRSTISRFLMDNNYPCCITTSHVFMNSQLAFRVKVRELSTKNSQNLDTRSFQTQPLPQNLDTRL